MRTIAGRKRDKAVFLAGLAFALTWARGRAASPPHLPGAELERPAVPPAPGPAPVTSPTRTRKRRGSTLLLSLAAASLTLNAYVLWGALRDDGSGAAARARLSTAATLVTTAGASEASVLPTAASATSAPTLSKVMTERRVGQASLRGRRVHVDGPSRRTRPSGRTPAPRASRALTWDVVPNASYYNVVLWRDGKRFLDLWPETARVVLPRRAVEKGAPVRLTPGRYLWFVYPGFGPKGAQRYGSLAGSGVLVVQSKGGL